MEMNLAKVVWLGLAQQRTDQLISVAKYTGKQNRS